MRIFSEPLNDNLGVEVKGALFAFERQLRERVGGIQAIAGMKLRQVRLQHPSFWKVGQDLVSDPFVVRHPAVRALSVDHARTEDGIGSSETAEQALRQFFRRILAVAVQKGDDIESVIDWRSDNRASGYRRNPWFSGVRSTVIGKADVDVESATFERKYVCDESSIISTSTALECSEDGMRLTLLNRARGGCRQR